MSWTHHRTGTALAAAASLILLAGCSDSPTDPGTPGVEPVTAEVYERGTDNRLAYVHGDHWHGGIDLHLGEEIEVDVRFLDASDQVIPLGGEYTVEAEVAPGERTDVVHVHGHGDHVDIEAEAVGETHVILHFWHDNHADWSTPPLRVTVGAGGPAGAEVYERGTDNRLAYVHGDHWHGGVDLILGQEIEVDVRFLDANDEVIPLGGEYTVEAEIAPGEATGLIHLHAHGDHLDIDAEGVGETRIVLHLWHDDHADWSTPPLRVTVDAGEPATAEVYERGTETRLAYVHGDHWHGGVEVGLGDEAEVDVHFLNEYDHVIPLGGEYTVEAEIAPGEATGLIHLHAHGDHLDIEGEAVGETRILIHFWHDDHADWTTPPLRVTVTDD